MQIKLKQAIYDLYTGILILYAMYESNYDEEYLNAYVYKTDLILFFHHGDTTTATTHGLFLHLYAATHFHCSN